MENPHTETMTIADAAKRLGKNKQYVRELIKRGFVPWGYVLDNGGRLNYLIITAAFEKWIRGEQ